MTLYYGTRLVDPEQLGPADISLPLIATSLGRIPRFVGQGNRVITVAQHSLALAEWAPRNLRLHALLHDAAESLIGDIPAPIKDHLGLAQAIEDGFLMAVCEKYSIDPQGFPLLTWLDKALARQEWEMLHHDCVPSLPNAVLDQYAVPPEKSGKLWLAITRKELAKHGYREAE